MNTATEGARAGNRKGYTAMQGGKSVNTATEGARAGNRKGYTQPCKEGSQ